MSAQRIIRMGVASLASAASIALSWPYWRDFEYWAESRTMWLLYFTAGFLLASFVFYVFMGCLATLFEHDAIERANRSQAGNPGAVKREHAS